MKQWYAIQAKAGEKRAKINIYEQIGESFWEEGISAKNFIAELDALDVDAIDLHINSPGGSVFDGTAIYNSLKAHKANVIVTVDGIAASIASVIVMAGDTVRMPENAMLMIHDPYGMAVGSSSVMRKAADTLEKIKDGIVSIYANKTKKDRAEIQQMMADETWISANEAVELGFADVVVDRPVNIQNCAFDLLNQFRNVPRKFWDFKHINHAFNNKMAKEEPMPNITLESIKQDYPEIANALIEEGKAAGTKAGAQAERERINAVRAQLLPGHEKLIEDMANDGVTTGEQAAVRILQAEQQLRAQVMQSLQADASALPNVPATNPPESDPPADLSSERGIKALWDKDKDLRAEFAGDFDAYKAYQIAVNRGLIRVLRK